MKKELIEEAKTLVDSEDFAKTSAKFRELMDKWKAVGSAGKQHENKLWDEFNEVRQKFYDRRNAYYEELHGKQDENYNAKKTLSDQAKEIADKKEYTREKYLFSLFWGMITVIGGILLVVIVTAAKGTLLMRSEEIVMTVLLNIPMLLIFQSMALPFLLKYEAEKGRIALAAMIGGIVFVVIFFFKMFETAGIELIDIVMNQMYLKNITLWASIYIISIVIWFLSLKIAEGIMLKKEF